MRKQHIIQCELSLYIDYIINTLEKRVIMKDYLLDQQRVQSMIQDDEMFFKDGRLNEHGFDMPTIPRVTYDMVSDDKFMVAKMDEMVIRSGTRGSYKDVCNELNEHVQIVIFDWIIWNGTRLPLNSQERSKMDHVTI